MLVGELMEKANQIKEDKGWDKAYIIKDRGRIIFDNTQWELEKLSLNYQQYIKGREIENYNKDHFDSFGVVEYVIDLKD